jgi:hypothetical protein
MPRAPNYLYYLFIVRLIVEFAARIRFTSKTRVTLVILTGRRRRRRRKKVNSKIRGMLNG